MTAPVPPWFERVLYRSVQAGLCPLIPVPIVDDWTMLRVKRWMVADAFARHGRPRDDAAERILAGAEEARGILRGLVVSVLWKPVKWVFRKTFFVLSIKAGIDLAARAFQEGYLLEIALARGLLEPGAEGARRVRAATAATCAALDPGPVRQLLGRTFHASRDVALAAAALLGSILRRDRLAEEGPGTPPQTAETAEADRLVSRILAPVVHALWYREDYLAALAVRFGEELERERERSEAKRVPAEADPRP